MRLMFQVLTASLSLATVMSRGTIYHMTWVYKIVGVGQTDTAFFVGHCVVLFPADAHSFHLSKRVIDLFDFVLLLGQGIKRLLVDRFGNLPAELHSLAKVGDDQLDTGF